VLRLVSVSPQGAFVTHMLSRFSDISMWTSNFWNELENYNVGGDVWIYSNIF